MKAPEEAAEPKGLSWFDYFCWRGGAALIFLSLFSLMLKAFNLEFFPDSTAIATDVVGIGLMAITGIGRLTILINDVQDLKKGLKVRLDINPK